MNSLVAIFVFGLLVKVANAAGAVPSSTEVFLPKPQSGGNCGSATNRYDTVDGCLYQCQASCTESSNCAAGVHFKRGSSGKCEFRNTQCQKDDGRTWFLRSQETNGCGDRHFNIIWVLDESGSIGSTNFGKMKEFVAQVSATLHHDTTGQILDNSILITFGTRVNHQSAPKEKCALEKAAIGLSYNRGYTNIQDGLNKARAKTVGGGSFANKRNVVIILSDGEPTAYYDGTRLRTSSRTPYVAAQNAAVTAANSLTGVSGNRMIYGYIDNAKADLFKNVPKTVALSMGDWDTLDAFVDTIREAIGSVICSFEPTASPTTPEPTINPTAAPTTAKPTTNPTSAPTTAEPTSSPTQNPTTASPTGGPTVAPTTASPTTNPTAAPTTAEPTSSPTQTPTTASPSGGPTANPTTASPTTNPTAAPTTAEPTSSPTQTPTTASPSGGPTANPTTASPTTNPTLAPTTADPTASPTLSPTQAPSFRPTANPTQAPSFRPTTSPSESPTAHPSTNPTVAPSFRPTTNPTLAPSSSPTLAPSDAPTTNPTLAPSNSPTTNPTFAPTTNPTAECVGARALISIDQSLSIRNAQWRRERSVLEALIDTLPVHEQGLHAAVTSFGTEYIDVVPPAADTAGVTTASAYFAFASTFDASILKSTTQSLINGARIKRRYTNFIPLFETYGKTRLAGVNQATIVLLSDGEPFERQYRRNRRRASLVAACRAAKSMREVSNAKLLCFQASTRSRASSFYKCACDATWLARDRLFKDSDTSIAEQMKKFICQPKAASLQDNPCEPVNQITQRSQRYKTCRSVKRDNNGLPQTPLHSQGSFRPHCYVHRGRCKLLRRFVPIYKSGDQ